MNALLHPSITQAQIEQLEEHLKEGERPILVFPSQHKCIAIMRMFLYSFAAVWIGGLIPNTCIAGFHSPDLSEFFCNLFYLLFALSAVPFVVAIEIALIRANRHIVALTDRRLVVVVKKQSESVPLDEIAKISYLEREDQSGDLILEFNRVQIDGLARPTFITADIICSRRFDQIGKIAQLVRACCSPQVRNLDSEANLDPKETLLKTEISRFLDDDETLAWAATPQSRSRWSYFRAVSFKILLFALFLLSLGGVCWAFVAAVIHSSSNALFYMLFCGIFSFIFSKFFNSISTDPSKTTIYALTNKRALEVKRILEKFLVVSYPIDNLGIVSTKERKDGSNDLIFFEKIIKSQDSADAVQRNGFIRIAALDGAVRVVRAICR